MKKAVITMALIATLSCFLYTGCGNQPEKIESQPSAEKGTNINHTLREEKDKLEQKVDERLIELKADNEDVIALIQIPDTLLDYPLMYRAGEEEYYLRKNLQEEYDIAGLPFMQQGCSLDENNIFIYGHYFKTGEMFGCLHNYLDNKDFYESHKDIFVTTSTEVQTWRIFAVCEMQIDDEGFVYNSSEYIDFNTRDEFNKYFSNVMENNKVETDETVKYNERIMFLSTCYDYSGSSKRIVAFAKQIQG